ncbi:MAG: glucosamine-6-phosphate deaminase [Candidatus Sericytochromatia bacterium]|nr:glucosamine-6-phosphate deaminase [Candidatus Tanganyikabacteria bacterium]
MDIWIHPDAASLARSVAREIAAQLAKPSSVLALASGRTPVPVYDELVAMHDRREITFRGATVFALDEYLGRNGADVGSFGAFFADHLFGRVDLPRERAHVPDGRAADPARECRAYEARILAAGGIDLCLLGLGRNGHVAFNEPGPILAAQAHVAEIADQTREGFPPELADVRHGLTMGMATILNARRVILVATGPDKADIVTRALVPVVDPWVPASLLQLHPNAVFALDGAAARDLVGGPEPQRHVVRRP